MVPFVVALGFANEKRGGQSQQEDDRQLEGLLDDRTRDDDDEEEEYCRNNLKLSMMTFPNKARFELEDMFFSDSFGQPLKLTD